MFNSTVASSSWVSGQPGQKRARRPGGVLSGTFKSVVRELWLADTVRKRSGRMDVAMPVAVEGARADVAVASRKDKSGSRAFVLRDTTTHMSNPSMLLCGALGSPEPALKRVAPVVYVAPTFVDMLERRRKRASGDANERCIACLMWRGW